MNVDEELLHGITIKMDAGYDVFFIRLDINKLESLFGDIYLKVCMPDPSLLLRS